MHLKPKDMMYLKSKKSLIIQYLRQFNRNFSKKSFENIEIPPEPTTCCMSGCTNCVWIEYAERVSKLVGDGGERTKKLILDKITDPNLKMFLELELRTRLKKKDD